MIAGLEPYPAMKDSGVPWLGKVPKHWEVRRLKYVLRERDVRSPEGTEQLLRVSQFTGVTERRGIDGGDEPDTRAESLVGYKAVEPNDLVINIMLAWNGSMGVSSFFGIASPAYGVYRFSAEAQPWYFHHLLRSPIYKARIKAVSTGVVESRLRLYTDDLYRLEALLPPPPEQAAIVRFLDHADRRIRRYIRAKQKLIALLEEQKQAIIHRAVTRGLDPNVRLKPSGVEWLGEVPEHWSRAPMRQLAARGRSTFVNGPFGSDLLTSELMSAGVPVIYIRDISGGSYRRVSKAYVTAAKAASLEFCQVTAGDVLVAKVGDPPGTAAIYPEDEPDGIVTQDVIRIRPDTSRVIADYLVAYLNSWAGRVAVGPVVVESTRGRVSLPDFRAVPVVLPPLAEQKEILDELGTTTADIAAAVGKAQREIDLLREYRTRLIADVVTGKLDVREAAARLPDESDEVPLDAADADPRTDDEPADDLDATAEEAAA